MIGGRVFGAWIALVLLLAAPMALAAEGDVARNKALVNNFWNDVFIARNADAAQKYLRPDYVNHNPHVPSGVKGFEDFFRQAFSETPANFKVEIVRLVAEGDIVVAYSQYSGTDPQGKPFTGYGFDMFRIKDGMIAEHWDQVEPEP
jgi:predicted SnoaL-like aldol condensation-catalyzing enzyme